MNSNIVVQCYLTRVFWVRVSFLGFMVLSIVFCQVGFVIVCLRENQLWGSLPMILLLMFETYLVFRLILPLIENDLYLSI